MPKVHDPEETREEAAARRIDKAAELWGERNDRFAITLRNNARGLTPYKRELTIAWLKRHCERLQQTLEEGEVIPPLDLNSIPDMEG